MQTRIPKVRGAGCEGRFAKLRVECGPHVPAVVGLASSGLSPFGQDPAFNPSSRLFSHAGTGVEQRYYNTSEGSTDLTAVGYPAAFFPRAVPGHPPGFPIFFPVCFLAHPHNPKVCPDGGRLLRSPHLRCVVVILLQR